MVWLEHRLVLMVVLHVLVQQEWSCWVELDYLFSLAHLACRGALLHRERWDRWDYLDHQ
jgi:hypothetical protein